MTEQKGRRFISFALALLLSCVATWAVDVEAGFAGTPAPTLVSRGLSGTTANGASYTSTLNSVSGDGRYIVFTSSATNLVPGDTNGAADVFVADHQGGTVTRVSVSDSGGMQGLGGGAYAPSISENGNFVAFVSEATNLVANDVNGRPDVFLRDLSNNTTTLISSDSDGFPIGVPSVNSTSVSARGSAVVYTGDHVWLRALGSSSTPTQVDITTSGANGASSVYHSAEISADGTAVVFSSPLALDPTAPPNRNQIYLRDLVASATTMISRDANGTPGNGDSFYPSISGDGSKVVFRTEASNISGVATTQVVLRDRNADTLRVVSVGTNGQLLETGYLLAEISTDGSTVLFGHSATGFVGSPGGLQLFARLLEEHMTLPVSVSANGVFGNDASAGGGLSSNGRTVAYWSVASNLVSGDTNGVSDVFVKQVASVPAAPAILTLAAGSSSLTVRLAPPSNDGGAPVNAFVIRTQPHTVETIVPADQLQTSLNGLTNGTRYSVEVRARNVIGDGPPAVGPSTLVSPLARFTGNGYRFVAADGGVFSFGNAPFNGSAASLRLTSPIVATTQDLSANGGYWMATSSGSVLNFGTVSHGDLAGVRLNHPVVGLAATPTGRGYWLVASDGGIFAFGDAQFFGSTGAIQLNRPIVGMSSTPTGRGYWLVASDGGIFTFGDAQFFGSTGAIQLNRPIVGMTLGG